MVRSLAELPRVRSAACDGRRATARPERRRLLGRAALRQPEGHAGCERVPGAVRVNRRAGQGRGGPCAAIAVDRHEDASRGTGGARDEAGRRLDVTGRVALPLVLCARHQHVDLDPRLRQRIDRAHGRDELTRSPRRPHRRGIAGGEVDGIGVLELGPGKRVIPVRPGALADHRDRALALGVEVDKRPPLRLGAPRRLDPNPESLQLSLRAVAEVVVAKRGEEEALAGQARELHRGDGSAACRLLPVLERPERSRRVPGRSRPARTRPIPRARRQRLASGWIVSHALNRLDATPTVLIARRLPTAGTDRLAETCSIEEGGLSVTPERLIALAPGVEAIVADPTVEVGERAARGGRPPAPGGGEFRCRDRQRGPRRVPSPRCDRHQYARRAHGRDGRAGARPHPGRSPAHDRGRGRPAGRPVAGAGPGRLSRPGAERRDLRRRRDGPNRASLRGARRAPSPARSSTPAALASPGAERGLGAVQVELEELLRRADVVSLHVPATRETTGLIGRRELARDEAQRDPDQHRSRVACRLCRARGRPAARGRSGAPASTSTSTSPTCRLSCSAPLTASCFPTSARRRRARGTRWPASSPTTCSPRCEATNHPTAFA